MKRPAAPLKALILALAPAMAFGAGPDDLTELNLESLMQVTITGASKYEQAESEVAAAVSVITRDEIKAFGWRTLAEALNSLPGVHTTYDRQYTYLGLRGFGLPADYNTRVLIAVNGNRINDVVYDAALAGDEFPLSPDLIERIEFIPGPGGAVYGQNAMLGVVNVVTRQGAGLDGAELVAAWRHPQSMGELGARWGRLLDNGANLLLSASASRAQGQDLFFDYPGAGEEGADVAGRARGLDGLRSQRFFAQLARGPWSLDLVYADRRKDDPTASFAADPLVDGQYQEDTTYLANLAYQDTSDDGNWNLLARLFFGRSEYAGNFVYEGSDFLSTATGQWLGAEARAVYAGFAGHTLLMGAEMQDNLRARQEDDDKSEPGLENSIDKPGKRIGLYVQDDWRFAEKWSATLGLRVDHNDSTGSQWSPRAALIWRASPATTLKALYGRAHRAPNTYERDYDDGGLSQIANPDLDGETIDTLELVADRRVSRDLSLRASLYHWRMQGLITLEDADAGGEVTRYVNGEKVRASGVELSGLKSWQDGARLRASLAFQDLAYQDGTRLLNAPRWLGKLNYSTPLPWQGLRLGAELTYDGERLGKDGSDVDDYWLANLNLSTGKWAKGLEVSLGIHNLFDRRYRQPAGESNWQNALEQDGRAVRVRVEYRF